MSYYKGSGFGGRGGGTSFRGSSYRGSRGNDGGGSWRGSRGGSSYTSGRGGVGGGGSSSGKYYDSVPVSYDSRSKTSYMGGGSTDRYSTRSRSDDYRYSSQAIDDYGPRFVRASPDPPRKRLRSDTSPSYNMASRRSHERSFSSNDYSGRSFYDKGTPGGGYLTEKGSYREVRETRAGADYSFRKPGTSFSPRGGSFRGRTVRGIRRGFRTGSTSFLSRKKMAESYGIRKRITSRSREYFLRRLKHYRLKRSSGTKDDDKKKASDDEQDDEDDDAEKDEEVEEEGEEESSADGEDDEKAETDKEGKEDGEATVKVDKEDEDGDDNKDKDASTEKKEPKKKIVKKKKVSTDGKEMKEGEEAQGDDSAVKEGDTDKPLTNFLGQKFIQLKCPHCAFTCVTFKEYSKHLPTKKHINSMQSLSNRLRSKLTTMRIEQREKQRVLDDECKTKNLRLSTFFCSICKLNYRTLKSAHQTSFSHKKMKSFVLPYCKICRAGFKSPWAYESHLCDLLHIKRKARVDKLARPPPGQDDVDPLNDLDTNHFMVLDAVGSGDDDSYPEKSDEENADGKDKSEKGEDSEKKKKKKKEEIKLGAEHCKLVEVYFCELCKIYLPRFDDKDRTLTLHCRSRTHLQRYVRHRDDRTLRKRAVMLHKEHEKEKETLMKSQKKEDDDVVADGVDVKIKSEETGEPAGGDANPLEVGKKDEPSESDDKIWSEVDKHLSALLQENEEPTKSDDDDDSRQEGERYDRFKQSDKVDKLTAEAAVVKSTSTTANGNLSTSEKKKIESTTSEEN